ncbi:hypothetical protein [Nocardioides yefusunii]|uniref:PD40 domain-containing protein n=1 Tax=Nocardioides yefusunii TaxID=2500546 RepID=A0ABW1QWJ3_9ACTN|nr:hypothetical protein [Nocardioides yefusunii]
MRFKKHSYVSRPFNADGTQNGGTDDGFSLFPAISGDGKKITFISTSANLDKTDKVSGYNVFMWEKPKS